jgi:hypothetical protein
MARVIANIYVTQGAELYPGRDVVNLLTYSISQGENIKETAVSRNTPAPVNRLMKKKSGPIS